MEELRSWAMAICIACLLCSALSMLIPDNSSKKLLTAIFSAMLLIVLFKPIGSINEYLLSIDESAFEPEKYENSELDSSIKAAAEGIYSKYIEDNCASIMRQNDIRFEKIIISMDNPENDSISIGQVEVIIKNEDIGQAERIKKLIFGITGIEPAITMR